MKKSASVILLLIVIVASTGFVFLKSQALSSEDNHFNKNWRAKFAASPLWRQVLNLHFDGDGRDDYLGNRYAKILIEVDVMDGMPAQTAALGQLAEKIESITGKPTAYLVSDRNVRHYRDLDDGQIENLVDRYRIHKTQGDTAVVYLLYASRDRENPDKVGTTFREYGIVLYADALREFTRSNPKTLVNYETSTALHEFGHQIGLPHNDRPDCLMNAEVEIGRFWETAEDVIVDFCEYELSQLSINR